MYITCWLLSLRNLVSSNNNMAGLILSVAMLENFHTPRKNKCDYLTKELWLINSCKSYLMHRPARFKTERTMNWQKNNLSTCLHINRLYMYLNITSLSFMYMREKWRPRSMIIYQFHAMQSNKKETKSLKILAKASISLFGDAGFDS